MWGQEPVGTGRRQTEVLRDADDSAGGSAPAGVAAGHSVSALRDARARIGGHRNLPWRCGRNRGKPDVSEEGVSREMGKDSRWRQLLVLGQSEILFTANRVQVLQLTLFECILLSP